MLCIFCIKSINMYYYVYLEQFTKRIIAKRNYVSAYWQLLLYVSQRFLFITLVSYHAKIQINKKYLVSERPH